MNKYYWIPAVGEPKLIESEDSVNKVWHDLMNSQLFCILIAIFASILSSVFYNILFYSIKFITERKIQNHKNQSNSPHPEDLQDR